MSLDFALPLGNPSINTAVATTLTQSTQQPVWLERIGVTAKLTATATPATGIITRITVANQSLFVSNGGSLPVEMLFPSAFVDKSDVVGAAIAAGSNVEVIVTPDAAADVSAYCGTAPVPAGQTPGEFSLDDLALFFPMGDFGALANGATGTLTSTCTRDCQLGRIVGSTDGDGVAITGLRIAGESQLAGAGGIEFDAIASNATDEDGLVINKPIQAGEQVEIDLENFGAVAGANATFVRVGIFCL